MRIDKPLPGTQLNLSHPLSRGLVGCWLFNEQSGMQAYDSSPYKNYGTLYNFNDPSSKDKSSQGLKFDGVNDYLYCNNSPSLNITNAITIEALIKTSDNTIAYQVVMSKRHAVDGIQYGCRIEEDDLKFNMVNMPGGGVVVQDVIPKNNKQYHIVITYNKQYVTIYIDGKNVKKQAVTTAFTPNSANVSIGKRTDNPSQYFKGTIDEIKLYNRDLSTNEAKQLYINPYCMFVE